MSDTSKHLDKDVVVWVRLPHPMSVRELKKMLDEYIASHNK